MKSNQIIEDLAMISRNAVNYIIELERKVNEQQQTIRHMGLLNEFPGLPKLTPSFDADTLPVRRGVYMVDQTWKDDGEPQWVYSYWSREGWHPQGSTPEAAMKYCFSCIRPPFRAWRGIEGEPMCDVYRQIQDAQLIASRPLNATKGLRIKGDPNDMPIL